ncbi:acyltransferase [Poseidonibacter ostreae]|uniref:Acyltransferase n=1 Tax=Poseidonibacter ostreae TaxID=2654171 RepID=A0A6L4WTV3_9BACT|nr:acyltransferase [Poseidonibacter ostreae]KAB7889775.1 acyltransferase [Poseidonibacter ostreae]
MIKTSIKKIFRYIFTFLVKRESKKVGADLKVNFYSKLNNNTELGNNVNMNGLEVSGKGSVTIGDNFHCGKNCLLITQNHNYKGNKIPYDETYILKEIIIEDNVWLGHNVTIIGSCKIGEGSIIQAGAVVVNDIEPLSIAGGNPAKVFSKRDAEHYYTLKNKGKFH